MEKNHVINHSLTQLICPETEAFALKIVLAVQLNNSQIKQNKQL